MTKNIVLLGLPGVGKGTNADLIVKDFDLPHISTGDMFRAAMANETELGQAAKRYMDAGDLVPDEITNGIVHERLLESDVQAAGGFLLDGFPRNVEQADDLKKFLADQDQAVDGVIYIAAPDEVVMERMTGRHRADDTPEVIANRIKVAKEQTMPLVDYYENEQVLKTIDGTRDVEAVYADVKAALDSI